MEKILHLTLKKKWFDLFASGIKKEEYREIKDYWIKRLHLPDAFGVYPSCFCESCISLYNHNNRFPKYNKIELKNGYSASSPILLFEFEIISIGIGKPEWGAPKEPVFIIRPGKEISRNF